MTITIDKRFTLASQLPTIKEKIKVFKSYFTDNDLLRMYTESTAIDIDGEVIKCTVSAFASNYVTNDASFMVEMIVDCLANFHRIRFYIDETEGTYAFNSDELLINHDRFGYIH